MTRKVYHYDLKGGGLLPERRGRGRKSAHVYGAPNGEYVDIQLPAWCEEHKAAGGKFTKDGKCVMSGLRQIEETMARCNDNEAGVKIEYQRPHYRPRR